MTITEALSEARKRAARGTVQHICYHAGHPSPDWRHRYIVGRYLDYAASYPGSVQYQVLPDGRVLNRAGKEVSV